MKDSLMIFIIAISIIGFIYSIIAFFKYYFYLKDDKLIVQKGVFKKSKIEIPFDRIQSINYEQNIIHRLFNVVKLNMDTAGSVGSELQINALDHKLANAISDHILKHRSELSATMSSEERSSKEEKKVIFRLSIPQLLKVGITENHLRSGGIIIFFFFWLWDNLRELGLDFMERMDDYAPMAKVVSASLIVISSLVVLFILVSFLISLIRTVLRYYNLIMYRIGEGFSIESGLLNRREYAAKDHKIQVLTWSQNLLQSWSSIFELRLTQASSIAVNDRKSLSVAGLEWEDVKETEAYLFKNDFHELSDIETYPVHPYYRFRRMYYWTIILVPTIIATAYFQEMTVSTVLFLWYLLGMVSSQLKFKKKRFGITDNLLLLQGGTFGKSETLLQLYKLQNIKIHSTPLQRRRELSSLTLYTASGQVSIPDIGYTTCVRLKNYLLYKIESSSKSWF